MEVPITPGEEKPESTDKKPVGRVRNAAEVLQQWLHFRASSEKPDRAVEDAETDEEEDNEEEEDSTIKRWRTIFKKFFGSQVSKEEQPVPSHTSQAARYEQPRLPLFMAETASGPTDLNLPTETPVSVPELPSFQPDVVEPTTDTPVEVPLDPVIAARYEQPEVTLPLRTTEVQPVYSRPIPEVVPRQVGDVYDDEIARRDEVNLQRSNLVNTYRNHRRKKDIREANREIDHLKQEQHETTKALKQEIKNVKTKLQAEQVKAAETAPVAPPLPQFEQATQQPKIEAAPEPARPEVRLKPEPLETAPKTKPPESVKEILQKRTTVEAKPQIQKQAEKLASHTYETVDPEVILEQVEQAAEADVAIEGLFERRHEVKDSDAAYKVDDPSTSATGLALTTSQIHSVSSPIADNNSRQSPASRWVNQPKNSEEAYKQAAMGGFWAAVMLLLFIGILLIIR